MRQVRFIMAFNDEWDNIDKAIKKLNDSGKNIEVVETPAMDVTDIVKETDSKVKMYLMKCTEKQYMTIRNSCNTIVKDFTM